MEGQWTSSEEKEQNQNERLTQANWEMNPCHMDLQPKHQILTVFV